MKVLRDQDDSRPRTATVRVGSTQYEVVHNITGGTQRYYRLADTANTTRRTEVSESAFADAVSAASEGEQAHG